jgi:fused signal recognition particle receptor
VDAVTFAIVIAVILVVAVVAGGIALVGGRRGGRPLPPAEAPDLRAGAPGSTGSTGSTDVVDRPAEAPDLTAPGTEVVEPEIVAEPELAEPELPVLERPEPAAGRLVRLRGRLARSNSALGKGLLALLSRDTLDAETWDEIEETLLLADVGVEPATELVDRLKSRVTVLGTRDATEVRDMLREELLALVDPEPGLDRSLAVERHVDRPAVVLVVGVNGTGKTTTVGKLARVLVAQDKDVVLGAADTFRAAAADQLETWGERVGVPTVRSDRDGADPAAVAFDAVRFGTEAEVDVVLVDTAGRLQNKVGLMDELGKVKRVVEKHGPVDEVLLVLDATTGQNGMQQARVFAEVVDVTGIVLTKLDGTAKGGIVIAVQRSLGVPVKLVGLGEGPDDLAPFDPSAFVDALVG